VAVKKGKEFAGIVGDLIENVPYLSDNQKNAWSAAVSNTADNASSTALSFAPLHALTDMAKNAFGKLATTLNRLVDQRSGFKNTLMRGVEGAKEILKHALETAPQQKTAYNKLVNDSTIAEVDPTKPRDYYKDQETRDNRSKQEVWDELNKRYNQLAPSWKRSYNTMRNAYEQMFKEIKKAIKVRIDATKLGKETKELVYRDIMESLTKSGVIEPYFSLGREGEHWLASNFVDKDGQTQFEVKAFKSPREREMRQKEILAMDPNARSDMYRQVSDVDYRRAPPSSFVNNALRIMEINNVPTDAIEEMMRLFVATLPETALAQSFQRRSGRAGYMEDSIAVFEKKMLNMSHQITNMVYNPKFDDIINRMELHTYQVGKGIAAGGVDAFGNQVKEDIKGKNNVEQARYLDEFKKRIGFIKNPNRDNLGNILQSAAFIYTMGFNPSSAIIQTANVPMIVMPSLKAAYPAGNVSKAIGDAVKVFMGSGTTAHTNVLGSVDETTGKPVTVGMKVKQSIANYQANSALGKQYETFVRVLNENGQLNRSQLGEILQGDINGSAWQKFKAMSGWMLHHTERMNREVTLIATYNLEMERLKKPNAQDIAGIEEARKEAELRHDRPVSTEEATQIYATNKAIDMNELTNGNISAASAPRIAQSTLGKIGFMYKRYAISMYYMLFKAYRDATKGESPEIRKAGWRQLGGVLGMTALMAGAQGIPLFGAASVLYGLFSDDDEDDLKAATQKTIGDFLYKGPIEYMTNLSIASRIGLNDLLIRDTTTASTTNTVSQQILQALGGPVLGVEQNFERGFSKIAQGHFERGVEDLLPSAIANTFKAYRYATQGTQTLRGDPITGDVSAGNVIAQALGFAPSNYIKQMEINDREKGIDKTLSDRQSKFKQRYYIAKREGDVDGMLDMREKLLELGQKHPELQINGGNINDILAKSIKAQERATKEMIAGVRYNKKRLKAIQEDIDEY
jgi:Large polyvalent protein associated domain 39/Myb/SANT-like DNA-binding domain